LIPHSFDPICDCSHICVTHAQLLYFFLSNIEAIVFIASM